MSKQIEKLEPGIHVYVVGVRRMGNTMIKTADVSRARVISVAEDKKSFVASWNGNPSRTYYAFPAGWKLQKPYLLAIPFMSFFRHRLASRVEIAKAKEAGSITERHSYFEVKES